MFDFTTNYFQAYDVALTNGLNTIKLTVKDRAGNVTVTNLDVTLDYTGATTPPTLAVDRPPADTLVSGEVFTSVAALMTRRRRYENPRGKKEDARPHSISAG